jgi:hypothetical protein
MTALICFTPLLTIFAHHRDIVFSRLPTTNRQIRELANYARISPWEPPIRTGARAEEAIDLRDTAVVIHSPRSTDQCFCCYHVYLPGRVHLYVPIAWDDGVATMDGHLQWYTHAHGHHILRDPFQFPEEATC